MSGCWSNPMKKGLTEKRNFIKDDFYIIFRRNNLRAERYR